MDIDSDIELGAPMLGAIEAGLAAMGGADVPVVVAEDFEGEIRKLTGQQDYSADRIAGDVAGKTISMANGHPVIVLNAPVVSTLLPARVERLVAHEACHALIDGRGESLTWQSTGALQTVGWRRVMVYIASNAVDEFRVEAAVMAAGYPIAEEADPDAVSHALMHANASALEAVLTYRESGDVVPMRDSVLAIMDRYSKQLGHLIAAQPHAPFSTSSLDDPARANWEALAAPVWEKHLDFYATIPDAMQPWPQPDRDEAMQRGLLVSARLMRSLGFEYRGNDENESFWSLRGEQELSAAAARWQADAARH